MLLSSREIVLKPRALARLIAKKLFETTIDLSHLVSVYSHQLMVKFVIRSIIAKLIELLIEDCNCKLKKFIAASLKDCLEKLPSVELTLLN